MRFGRRSQEARPLERLAALAARYRSSRGSNSLARTAPARNAGRACARGRRCPSRHLPRACGREALRLEAGSSRAPESLSIPAQASPATLSLVAPAVRSRRFSGRAGSIFLGEYFFGSWSFRPSRDFSEARVQPSTLPGPDFQPGSRPGRIRPPRRIRRKFPAGKSANKRSAKSRGNLCTHFSG